MFAYKHVSIRYVLIVTPTQIKMSDPRSSDADGHVKYRDTTNRFASPRYRERAIQVFDTLFPSEKMVFDGRWSTVADQEIHSINELSFVPTPGEIQKLNNIAGVANTAILNKERTTLLSRIAELEFSKDKNLCPESLNPNDTKIVTDGKKKGTIFDSEEKHMTVLNDLMMTYENSWGPNGVLLECQDAKLYGTNRINLFYSDENLVKKLLSDYLRFRNDNIVKIFSQYVNNMVDRQSTYQLNSQDSAKGYLADKLRPKYDLVCEMLQHVLFRTKFVPLADLGIGVVSFCQTWMSKPDGKANYKTQFSVMSPHFQTRFHVVNDEKLKRVPGVRPSHLQAYSDMVAHCHNNQIKNYKKAYVNLDELAEQWHLADGPRKRPRRTDVASRADVPSLPSRTDSWSDYAR